MKHISIDKKHSQFLAAEHSQTIRNPWFKQHYKTIQTKRWFHGGFIIILFSLYVCVSNYLFVCLSSVVWITIKIILPYYLHLTSHIYWMVMVRLFTLLTLLTYTKLSIQFYYKYKVCWYLFDSILFSILWTFKSADNFPMIAHEEKKYISKHTFPIIIPFLVVFSLSLLFFST